MKERHEIAVAKRLLGKLGEDSKSLRRGSPPEPDVLLGSNDTSIGIEVATAYYNQSDAQLEWEHARGQKTYSSSFIPSPDDAICRSIQERINEKCRKHYQGAIEYWLCIDVDAPLWDQESAKECVHALSIPSQHGFARVYLVWESPTVAGASISEVGGTKAVELYPHKAEWS